MTNSSTSAELGSTLLGYPRIGPKRELKKALERYWAGKIDHAELESVAAGLRADTWRSLSAAGLESIPGNTFSYYDYMLDNAVLFNAIPQRYSELGLSDIDTYFALARGNSVLAPLEMTKWFDTNYHYLVPEIGPETEFRISGDKPFSELKEAAELGVTTRPALPGPVTFLLLSKANSTAPQGFPPLDRLDDLVTVYAELLSKLHAAGAEWVQLDEPAFVADRTDEELDALRGAYTSLGALTDRPRLLVTGPYGDLGPALGVIASTPVEAIALDLVAGKRTADQVAAVPALRDKTVVAGVVDGHNVWRTDPDHALAICATLLGTAGSVVVGSSCSLLHVPYDTAAETDADPRVLSWLAFAEQKVGEIVTLQNALRGKDVGDKIDGMRSAVTDRSAAPELNVAAVRDRMSRITGADRHRGAAAVRAAAQRTKLDLPALPTTTIGSFPQTTEVRTARADLRAGRIDADGYRQRMRSEIERVIRLQEDIGLDVLVHGEPERNDMVQYFAEKLDGFLSTEFGWVQSYGSRCVRPPILYGDVSRPEPMTVEWSKYAQSLTAKPVKGMLTGPVTILAWSFVRDDQAIADTANQVAVAISDEVKDLEQAGIGIVQVDEPALRELLPLRARDHEEYLHWAVDAFRLATGSAADSTAIHTHMCYSEFGEIISAIDGIDADVTSIEAARSKMEIVDDLREFGRGVGPGVYDIHSPRVPDSAEIAELLRAALTGVNPEWLWVNPDCGLKTRGYVEVEPALRNMVAAANTVRSEL